MANVDVVVDPKAIVPHAVTVRVAFVVEAPSPSMVARTVYAPGPIATTRGSARSMAEVPLPAAFAILVTNLPVGAMRLIVAVSFDPSPPRVTVIAAPSAARRGRERERRGCRGRHGDGTARSGIGDLADRRDGEGVRGAGGDSGLGHRDELGSVVLGLGCERQPLAPRRRHGERDRLPRLAVGRPLQEHLLARGDGRDRVAVALAVAVAVAVIGMCGVRRDRGDAGSLDGEGGRGR